MTFVGHPDPTRSVAPPARYAPRADGCGGALQGRAETLEFLRNKGFLEELPLSARPPGIPVFLKKRDIIDLNEVDSYLIGLMKRLRK
jgi:hypothetical protein